MIEFAEFNSLLVKDVAKAQRIKELEDAIRKVVTKQADDLCWMDVYVELGKLVGVEITKESLAMLPTERFIDNCRRYCLSLKTGINYEPMSDDSFFGMLMARMDAKIFEIGQLNSEIERLRGIVNGIPHAIESSRKQLLGEMANILVSGNNLCLSGCHLARSGIVK